MFIRTIFPDLFLASMLPAIDEDQLACEQERQREHDYSRIGHHETVRHGFGRGYAQHHQHHRLAHAQDFDDIAEGQQTAGV